MKPEKKSESTYPTEHIIPTKAITAEGLIKEFRNRESEIEILVSPTGANRMLEKSTHHEVPQEFQFGDTHIFFGNTLDHLPGTVFEIDSVFEILKPVGMSNKNARELILGDTPPQKEPIAILRTNNGLFTLRIHCGAICAQADMLSKIGDTGVFTDKERYAYQSSCLDIMQPIFSRTVEATRQTLNLSGEALIAETDEDCLASLAHIEGANLAIEQLSDQKIIPIGGERINVVGGTLQAFTLLAYKAVERNIPTEVNTGLCALGLSEGIGPNGDHRNYVTLPPVSKYPQYQVFGNRIFILGDMGDGGQLISSINTDWNRFRPESLGLVRIDKDKPKNSKLNYTRNIDSYPYVMRFLYARGGFAMVGLRGLIEELNGINNQVPTIMAEGKRFLAKNRHDGHYNPALVLRHFANKVIAFSKLNQ